MIIEFAKEKENIVPKSAWINDSEKLVSFHYVEGAILYEAEEQVFWERIKALVNLGYRIQ